MKTYQSWSEMVWLQPVLFRIVFGGHGDRDLKKNNSDLCWLEFPKAAIWFCRSWRFLPESVTCTLFQSYLEELKLHYIELLGKYATRTGKMVKSIWGLAFRLTQVIIIYRRLMWYLKIEWCDIYVKRYGKQIFARITPSEWIGVSVPVPGLCMDSRRASRMWQSLRTPRRRKVWRHQTHPLVPHVFSHAFWNWTA